MKNATGFIGSRFSLVDALILRSTITFAAATLLVRIARMAQESLAAAHFGTSDEIEAFLVAWTIINFFVQSIAVSIHTALIPELVRIEGEHKSAISSSLLTSLALGALVLSAIFVASLGIWSASAIEHIAVGFSEVKRIRAVHLLLIMAVYFPIASLSLFANALLQARKRFFASAILSLAVPLTTIAFLIGSTLPFGMQPLVAGLLVGALLELTVCLILLHRSGLRVRFDALGHSHLRNVAAQAASLVAGSILMSSTALVDTLFASAAGSGAVASIAFGMRIPALLVGLLSVPLSAALLPYFAEALARNDLAECRRILARWIGFACGLGIPVTALFIFLSPQLVQWLFERGSFSSEDSARVCLLQQIYLLHVPPYIAGLCGVRLLIAANKTSILAGICALNLIVNITLNILGADLPGGVGVPLASVGMYTLAMIAILYAAFSTTRNRAVRRDDARSTL